MLARDAGLPDRVADLGFVAVVLRRVDVAVAVLEGVQAGGDAGGGRGLVDAEAEAGDLDRGIGEG